MTLWKTMQISVFDQTFIFIICLLGSQLPCALGLHENVPEIEVNPTLDGDDHSEMVEVIEDITIAEEEGVKHTKLDTSDDIRSSDVAGDFVVPGSGTKFSQLPHCSDKEKISHTGSDEAVLLVSTLDGFLHSIDLSSGLKRWQHTLGHKKLHSCSSAVVEYIHDGKESNILSSLDGFLYAKSSEQRMTALPVSIDSLVDSTFKISNDIVISGSKVSTVYGLSASTGAELYHCDGEGCKQGDTTVGQDAGQMSLTHSDDVLLIKKVMRNIHAADPLDGSPKFNMSAGLNHVELIRSGSCKAANRQGHQRSKLSEGRLPRPLFDRPQGQVWGINEDGSKAWILKLTSQIVDAWILDDGELSKLDLLQSINVPALVSRGVDEDMNGPSMYVGVHGKGEMFLHLSEKTKSKVQAYIAYNSVQSAFNWPKVEFIMRPSISWKPYQGSSSFVRPAYGQNDVLAIGYTPYTEPYFEDPVSEANTALSEVQFHDYADGDGPTEVAEVNNIRSLGFYLYDDDDDLVISPAIEGSQEGSSSHSLPHTSERGTSASDGAATIHPGPWRPRFVQEEHLDPDHQPEIPRHVHTWDMTWHLGLTSRNMQLLLASTCLLLSLRVLHRPWYDHLVWFITLPLAYFIKTTVKDLIRRDPEVQAEVYSAALGPYRGHMPDMLPTNANRSHSEHAPQSADQQHSPSLALDYGSRNESTIVETITETGNVGSESSNLGSSLDGRQGVHSHTNLTEYSPYTSLPPQAEVQREDRVSTTTSAAQVFRGPRLQIPTQHGNFASVYLNYVNFDVQIRNNINITRPALPSLPGTNHDPSSPPPLSSGDTSPPSAPPSTPSTATLQPSASESSMTNTSGEASSSPRSRIMDYDIRDVLGSGGFGIVFKAYLELDDHEYAIKRIPLPSKVENQRRVLREVRVLAKLNHMNIVRYYSCWQETHSTDWVREYDQPWRQKLKATCTAESFMSPVGDTTTSPTGSLTESSPALYRQKPLPEHSSSVTDGRRRCQSEPSEQEKAVDIEEESGDDLEMGREYNPLYGGPSMSVNKPARHALSNKYETDNSSDSFSIQFGDGEQGSEDEEDSDSGCGDNDDDVSSSSSSSQSDSDGAGLLMKRFNNSLISNDSNENSSTSNDYSKASTRQEISMDDNSDSIVFKDESSSSSSSADPSASDVGPPNDVSGSIVPTGKRTVSEGNEGERPVSGGVGTKKRSKSVSVSRPSSLAIKGHNLSDQSHSVKLDIEKEDDHPKKGGGKKASQPRGIKDFLYIQMELCDRKSLKEWLQEITDRPKLTVLKYFLDIVNAVEHVHDKMMMHRDLKPSNIFFELGKEDVVKVGDFGLGTSIADEEGNDLARTPGVAASLQSMGVGGQHTQNAGTLSYMSPEQREAGKANYTYKVDIFSMGLILFEMLWVMRTGQEKSRTLQRVREMTFPPTFAEQHPEEHELLKLMLHEDPHQRPTTRGIRARQPLRRLQLPHHVDNIREEEHFELVIKTHRRNTSSVSVTDLIPEQEVPVQE